MNHEIEHNRLSQLGDELLSEFENGQRVEIPVEFDRKCRKLFRQERKNPVFQILRWTARAAVLVFALIGVMTVTVLSDSSVRNGIVQFAAEYYAPQDELETYEQICYTQTGNAAMSVYYDGKSSYQILWANEYGKQLYDFSSYRADETFFHELSSQLTASEE